jgi:hypothetical protein
MRGQACSRKEGQDLRRTARQLHVTVSYGTGAVDALFSLLLHARQFQSPNISLCQSVAACNF